MEIEMFAAVTNPAGRPDVDLDADRIARCQPSPEQVSIARTILRANPQFTDVLVPIAFPGKKSGWWKADTIVEHVNGFWPADRRDPNSYGPAREAAYRAARTHLGDLPGAAAYAVIARTGNSPVFED